MVWLNYYNTKDQEARPLGRVRVFDDVPNMLYISSMRTYKECMKRVKEKDNRGSVAFQGLFDDVGKPVFVRWFDVEGRVCYKGVGMVERVF